MIGEPDELAPVSTDCANADDLLQAMAEWSFEGIGHVCVPDYYLAVSAAVRTREYRWLARDAARDDLAAA